MTHTPGPWRVSTDTTINIDGGLWTYSLRAGKNGKLIAALIEAPGLGEEALPNYALIAAAPDLLEALKTFMALRLLGYEDDKTLAPAFKMARDAIAKAEGN